MSIAISDSGPTNICNMFTQSVLKIFNSLNNAPFLVLPPKRHDPFLYFRFSYKVVLVLCITREEQGLEISTVKFCVKFFLHLLCGGGGKLPYGIGLRDK